MKYLYNNILLRKRFSYTYKNTIDYTFRKRKYFNCKKAFSGKGILLKIDAYI